MSFNWVGVLLVYDLMRVCNVFVVELDELLEVGVDDEIDDLGIDVGILDVVEFLDFFFLFILKVFLCWDWMWRWWWRLRVIGRKNDIFIVFVC